jgi:hypothetical protein
MRQKSTLAFACACALAVALIGAATLRAETTPDPEPVPTTTTVEESPEEEIPDLTQRERQKMIDRYRHETWRWQRVMGRSVTRKLPNPPPAFHAKIQVWKKVATRMRKHAQNPPHRRQWLCIHRYEGAWNDPNPPYFGGLQMDYSFMATYGPHLLRTKGTADRWTPLEQMWVAERAHRSGRGFYPWPNTARYCGLI